MNDQNSDRNRSDIEPIEVIFQRIAQKQQIVPQSIERGASYQAVHDPAPSSARSPDDTVPTVVLNVTTAPDAPREQRVVHSRPRRRASRGVVALALVASFAIGGALLQLVFR